MTLWLLLIQSFYILKNSPVLRSRAIFPRLQLQIYFLSGSGLKILARAPPIKSRLRPQKTDFDTKHMKNRNFNFKKALKTLDFVPKTEKTLEFFFLSLKKFI